MEYDLTQSDKETSTNLLTGSNGMSYKDLVTIDNEEEAWLVHTLNAFEFIITSKKYSEVWKSYATQKLLKELYGNRI